MIRRASIPGRINILGEHTDYAGGCSLAFASQHRLILEAEFIESGVFGEETVVALWSEAGGPPARLNVSSNIPIGKGMSSSAALCLGIVLCVHVIRWTDKMHAKRHSDLSTLFLEHPVVYSTK